MTERDFLASYDPTAFPPLAVATDVVVLAVREATLHALLVRRDEQPARGRWALPGTFVGVDEELDAAARRAMRDKVGLDAPVRQFHVFGGIGRDPRMRIISVGYMALLTADAVLGALDERHALHPIVDGAVRTEAGRRATLAFDHAEIIARALADLRRDLDRDNWAFGLLPPEFSLRELQHLHEAIRGETLNKPAFRKRLVESGRLEPTGRMESGKGFRPAELYRVRMVDHGER